MENSIVYGRNKTYISSKNKNSNFCNSKVLIAGIMDERCSCKNEYITLMEFDLDSLKCSSCGVRVLLHFSVIEGSSGENKGCTHLKVSRLKKGYDCKFVTWSTVPKIERYNECFWYCENSCSKSVEIDITNLFYRAVEECEKSLVLAIAGISNGIIKIDNKDCNNSVYIKVCQNREKFGDEFEMEYDEKIYDQNKYMDEEYEVGNMSFENNYEEYVYEDSNYELLKSEEELLNFDSFDDSEFEKEVHFKNPPYKNYNFKKEEKCNKPCELSSGVFDGTSLREILKNNFEIEWKRANIVGEGIFWNDNVPSEVTITERGRYIIQFSANLRPTCNVKAGVTIGVTNNEGIQFTYFAPQSYIEGEKRARVVTITGNEFIVVGNLPVTITIRNLSGVDLIQTSANLSVIQI